MEVRGGGGDRGPEQAQASSRLTPNQMLLPRRGVTSDTGMMATMLFDVSERPHTGPAACSFH